ncbi:uncharacterized protein [Branchiostoma lanceolatum]|uniref:uncharacterized protein n=1 Tax=Branchiostoma lanceolatum TaxID=7740 RepID=UPI003451BD31
MVCLGMGKGWVEDRNVMLQPVPDKQPATTLHLTFGITQHQLQSMYLLQTDDNNHPMYHNNRPVYKHEASPWYIYYWTESQVWWVGPDIHAARGGLYVEDSHVLPEDITGTWMVTPSREQGWVEDRNVSLHPVTAKQPAATLLLTGVPRNQARYILVGLYLLQTDDNNQPKYHNNRPVYKHEARERYIYYWKKSQKWWVGTDIHAARGGLQVKDSHVLPEDITGTWMVTPGRAKGWVEDRNVMLQPVVAIQPAASLLLTDVIDQKTHFMGQYHLQPVYHNNRPVYKHEASPWHIYFCKESQVWLVGPDIHAARGWLCVEDSHVLPEDITGTWMVTSSRGQGWVEDRNVMLQPVKQPVAFLFLTGVLQYQSGSMGKYQLQADANNHPVYHNNRPVYKFEAGEQYIYYRKESQTWWVGSDILDDQGGLYMDDRHILPEDVTGNWMVYTGKGWVEDGNVKLLPGSSPQGQCNDANIDGLHHTLFYTKAAKPPFLGGKAVIINNINFSQLSRRDGAEGDTGKVKAVLERFGLTVDTHTDQTVGEMLSIVRAHRQADHSGHGCFVCCIMTHGDQGKVCGKDGSAIDILELIKPVSGCSCPPLAGKPKKCYGACLAGKPKVFIVQACQGGDEQSQVNADAIPPRAIGAYISSEADVCLGLASVPGYLAGRSATEGGYYINKAVEVLTREGEKQDLVSMMTMVSDEMNNEYGCSPFYCSTLRKKLYFVLPQSP